MRWDAGIRCARILIDDGWLGIPTYGTIQVHCNTDWSLWPWIYQGKRLEVMFHSIHYIDSLRFLLGQPNSVFTSGSRGPAETTQAETKTLTVWDYASGLQVLIDVCQDVYKRQAGSPEAFARTRRNRIAWRGARGHLRRKRRFPEGD